MFLTTDCFLFKSQDISFWIIWTSLSGINNHVTSKSMRSYFLPHSGVWFERWPWWFGLETHALSRSDASLHVLLFLLQITTITILSYKLLKERYWRAWKSLEERSARLPVLLPGQKQTRKREQPNENESNQQSLFIPGLDPADWQPSGSYFTLFLLQSFSIWLHICTLCCWSSQHVPLFDHHVSWSIQNFLLTSGSSSHQCHIPLSSQYPMFPSRFLV